MKFEMNKNIRVTNGKIRWLLLPLRWFGATAEATLCLKFKCLSKYLMPDSIGKLQCWLLQTVRGGASTILLVNSRNPKFLALPADHDLQEARTRTKAWTKP